MDKTKGIESLVFVDRALKKFPEKCGFLSVVWNWALQIMYSALSLTLD